MTGIFLLIPKKISILSFSIEDNIFNLLNANFWHISRYFLYLFGAELLKIIITSTYVGNLKKSNELFKVNTMFLQKLHNLVQPYLNLYTYF